LVFLVFQVYPVFASLYFSFARWDLFSPPQFIGFANYVELAGDDVFAQVAGNTVYFVVAGIPVGMALSLFAAALLNQGLRLSRVYRAFFFLPFVTSGVAVATVWRWMYDYRFGLINYLLSLVGIEGPQWLFSATWTMPALLLVAVWHGLGFPVTLYLAALQNVPVALHESAMIDGANAWQRFWRITVPLISPTTFYILVMLVIGSFQAFDVAFNLTGGGPARKTTLIVQYLYNKGFAAFQMGYAAALAYIVFVVVLVLTLIQWRLRGRWVYGEEG
jgi:multiple sugar transport system permease protein